MSTPKAETTRRCSVAHKPGGMCIRPDWSPRQANQLAQLAKRAVDGMSFEVYEAVRARILEGKT